MQYTGLKISVWEIVASSLESPSFRIRFLGFDVAEAFLFAGNVENY